MARKKNALREHYVAAVPEGGGTPAAGDYKLLAQWITDITDDTAEEVESTAFYDGDGTPTSDVTSVAITYSFEGHYDAENEAQALIASMKTKVGEGRKIYHKVIDSNQTNQLEGIATVTDIVAGSGSAEEYEEFSCTIAFDAIPESSTPVTTTQA